MTLLVTSRSVISDLLSGSAILLSHLPCSTQAAIQRRLCALNKTLCQYNVDTLGHFVRVKERELCEMERVCVCVIELCV